MEAFGVDVAGVCYQKYELFWAGAYRFPKVLGIAQVNSGKNVNDF